MRWLAGLALAVSCASQDPIDAISRQVLDGKPVSEADKLKLCEKATRDHAEALFILLEKEGPKVAYAALFALAPLLDEKLLPRVEKLLDGARDAKVRALMLLAEARMGAALIEKRNFLDPADPELSRVALLAMGACRARGAHDAILEYHQKTDDDAAVKALGRIWEQKLSAPALDRKDEIRRLTVLLLARKLALSGAATEDFCEATLRVMTKTEFEKFLKDFSVEMFYSRRLFVRVAGTKGFDKEKGRALHAAFLASPDPGVSARILYLSPHELPVEKVGPLLDNTKDADIEDISAKTRVCDLAAWRLEAQVDKRPPELPLKEELLKKWKDWWAKRK